MTYRIYVLIDADTGIQFYVGRTMWGLGKRLNGHMACAKARRKLAVSDYIRSLKQRPSIRLLQEISDGGKGAASEAEFYWIDKLIKEGHPLVNRYFNVDRLITPRYRRQKYSLK